MTGVNLISIIHKTANVEYVDITIIIGRKESNYMTIREMQDEIIRLKKEKDFCVLVHAYQSQDILEVADFVGDSFGLSQKAAETSNKNVLMCGVRFMAETVKTLSPEKHVYLANPVAGCPMAGQIDRELLQGMKKENPNCAVVAYVNTTADTKREADMIVTSASAVKIVKSMPEKDILFVPDSNLGRWVESQIPEKNFTFFKGGCPTHMKIRDFDVERARKNHPDALLLVHPECLKEVVDQADYVGSTTGIMNFARESDAKEFVIGTEHSIVQHLQFEMPEKKFYALSEKAVCPNMKMTTLADVYNTLSGNGGEEIILDEVVIKESRAAIDRMIEAGK